MSDCSVCFARGRWPKEASQRLVLENSLGTTAKKRKTTFQPVHPPKPRFPLDDAICQISSPTPLFSPQPAWCKSNSCWLRRAGCLAVPEPQNPDKTSPIGETLADLLPVSVLHKNRIFQVVRSLVRRRRPRKNTCPVLTSLGLRKRKSHPRSLFSCILLLNVLS